MCHTVNILRLKVALGEHLLIVGASVLNSCSESISESILALKLAPKSVKRIVKMPP